MFFWISVIGNVLLLVFSIYAAAHVLDYAYRIEKLGKTNRKLRKQLKEKVQHLKESQEKVQMYEEHVSRDKSEWGFLDQLRVIRPEKKRRRRS